MFVIIRCVFTLWVQHPAAHAPRRAVSQAPQVRDLRAWLGSLSKCQNGAGEPGRMTGLFRSTHTKLVPDSSFLLMELWFDDLSVNAVLSFSILKDRVCSRCVPSLGTDFGKCQ